MTPERADIYLSPEQLDSLLPFGFVLDRSMSLIRVGRSLSKLYPAVRPGESFHQVMRLVDAPENATFETFVSLACRLSVITLRGQSSILRGQFTPIMNGSQLLFAGSPWLTVPSELEQMGLDFSDFAVHDPAIDLLHLVQAQSTSLADARRLTDALTLQRTELRKVNARLAAQEAESRKLAMIVARTDNAVILTDAQGRIEWVNDGFTKLTGFTLEEVLGRTPGSFLQANATDDDTINRMSTRIREGTGFKERVLNLAKDGTPYWVLIDAEPIHDAHGVVTNYVAIERDVTQEYLASQQADRLNTLNDITRQIVESFLLGHNLSQSIDLILAKVGEFLDVSRSYLFRYRQNKQRLSNTHEWCAPGVTPQSETLKELPGDSFPWWTTRLERNEAIVLEDVGMQAPNEIRDVLETQNIRALLVLPVFINGNLEAFIGFDDVRSPRQWRSEEVALLRTMVESLSRAIERRIGERDRASAAVQVRDALQRAESANQLKSAFLANMSHELRTPMTAIMGFANLLKRDAGSTQDRHSWATSIARNADHLLALLNDLLDLSKIEAGQLTTIAEPCDPAQVVADVVKQLRPLATDRSLTLEYIVDASPITTSTDSLRLRQVIVNLIGNAIRYTDAGFVRVRVSTSMSVHSETVVISVADSGIGIPEEKHSQLFMPFSQINADAQRRGGGVGLGLNISRKLTELLGGSLTFTSAVGVGSEFLVTLPIITPKSANAHQHHTSSRLPIATTSLLAGLRILLVEDNPDNRKLLTYLLIEAGASVTQTEDGQIACEICERFGVNDLPFDVILMDMQMPVLDGYNATERLRKAGFTTPILALTAFAMADDRDHCLRAGCDDYLSKPVDETKLLEKLALYCKPVKAHKDSSSQDPTRSAARFPGHASTTPAALTPLSGDRYWLEAVIKDFKGTLPDVREQLFKAVDSRDFLTASHVAHRLRGVAANFRLPDIAAAAADFEDEYRANGKSDRLAPLGTRLLAAILEAIRDSK